MALRLALAGDTMLGRGVAEALRAGREPLLDEEVLAVAADADLFVVNLECCISDGGEPWPAPRKPFFFRAPPRAAELLASWGVDCVTLANNHALDFGRVALLDTLDLLAAAGVAAVGAGPDEQAARAPLRLSVGGARVALVAATDHPSEFAAGPGLPGVAYADLRAGVPSWLTGRLAAEAGGADALVCLVHWGPNMTRGPVRHVRAAAPVLVEAGADLVAGHSAHVPHGAAGRVLYDLGDFLDDYRVDPDMRNDLGLLFLVTLEDDGRVSGEAIPLALDFCHTRLAHGGDAALVGSRFTAGCEALGGEAERVDERVRFRLS